MTRTEARRRVIALLSVALAVAAQSAVVGSVANGDTARSAFTTSGFVTEEPFGVRLLDRALMLPDLSSHTATVASNDKPADRFTIADISVDRELESQLRDARFNWPHNLDSSGAPIELRQEHLAPLVRLAF